MNSIHSLRKTTYLIHIKSCDNFSCMGTIFDPVEQLYYRFDSLSHLILSLNALCDLSNWPLREPSNIHISPETVLRPIIKKPCCHDICSVLVDVLYRQHSSMQGKVTINAGFGNAQTICFRSELELMLLIQSSCPSQKRTLSDS